LSWKRREFLKGALSAPVVGAFPFDSLQRGTLVNDEHTGTNPTWVERIVKPSSATEIQELVKTCQKHRKPISVSASRHSSGGQQFATDSVMLDMRSLNRYLGFDAQSGILSVESGIEWPELIEAYTKAQGEKVVWGIKQKQGGGDRMSLGGAISANAHGHCIGSPPISNDVEWLDIVMADGSLRRCSRKENKELFSLVLGGYGLFGVITAVGLRLSPRKKLRRRVEARTLAEVLPVVEKKTKAGTAFGYFQYSIDLASSEFIRSGILTTYEPVPADVPIEPAPTDIDEESMTGLLEIAHKNPGSAYRRYAQFELSKSGSVEWSDLHQLSTYPQGYHKKIDAHLGETVPGADLIVEVYVPRKDLFHFLERIRPVLIGSQIPLLYGTVRFIEQDKDSYLAWAKQRYACVIFTLHTQTDAVAMKRTGNLCRTLLQEATGRGGSFYLTYNRFATRGELDAAYPQFAEFLLRKQKYDPEELFQSEWYRFYKKLYS
jgi:FAD/FMN-containing dehydrogenase